VPRERHHSSEDSATQRGGSSDPRKGTTY
jgi:hypothetical protein